MFCVSPANLEALGNGQKFISKTYAFFYIQFLKFYNNLRR